MVIASSEVQLGQNSLSSSLGLWKNSVLCCCRTESFSALLAFVGKSSAPRGQPQFLAMCSSPMCPLVPSKSARETEKPKQDEHYNGRQRNYVISDVSLPCWVVLIKSKLWSCLDSRKRAHTRVWTSGGGDHRATVRVCLPHLPKGIFLGAEPKLYPVLLVHILCSFHLCI